MDGAAARAARSYCTASGRYGTNSSAVARWKDVERRSSGMRYAASAAGRGLAMCAEDEGLTSRASLVSSERTAERVCVCEVRGLASTMRDAAKGRSGSGASQCSAAETRSPNSTREKGGARGEGGSGLHFISYCIADLGFIADPVYRRTSVALFAPVSATLDPGKLHLQKKPVNEAPRVLRRAPHGARCRNLLHLPRTCW